jgi:hypothetical protein
MTASTLVLIGLMMLGVLATPRAADAQPAGKIYRIGYLSPRSGPSHFDEVVRQGLRELGCERTWSSSDPA